MPNILSKKWGTCYCLSLHALISTKIGISGLDFVTNSTYLKKDHKILQFHPFHVYLPISTEFQSCYKQYMHSLGFKVRSTSDGGVIVIGIDNGKPIDHGYVSFSVYYWKWKKDYQDICQYCYVSFANCHRYLANHLSLSLHELDDKDDGKNDHDIIIIDGANAESWVMSSINQHNLASTTAEDARE